MTYTIECIISLGRFDRSKTLSAQLLDTAGAAVGAAVVPVYVGTGRYRCSIAVASDHRGAIVVTDLSGNVVQATAVNPEEWWASTYIPHRRNIIYRSGPTLRGVIS